ncbi:MAG: hypothetical protein PVI86_15855 [Phycisphaerae bacterium]|jgi:hypothetical protein
MSHYRFRYYSGAADAERQYDLWLRATEGLPRAWRSNMTNVRHCLKGAETHPQARIYAENAGGELVGYIGTHAPFEWYPGGWTLPFGFPWTHPIDEELESSLYARMIEITPRTYPGHHRNLYIQRFRESWVRHIAFMLLRGWRRKWRYPILSCRVDAFKPGREVAPRPMEPADLPAVCDFASSDSHVTKDVEVNALRREFDEGWLDLSSAWIVPETGAFVLDVRPPWAEVKLCHARPGDAFDTMLRAIAATSAKQNVSEIYFTLDEIESERHRALVDRGFEEVDAGVYLVLELESIPEGRA